MVRKWVAVFVGTAAMVMTVAPPALSQRQVAAAASMTSAQGVIPDDYTCSEPSFIDFEEFPDRTNLSSTVFPGIHFTTTGGTDWVVGDFSTGNYNGKYPAGSYTSRGTHWAWLGETQGLGRIDLARLASSFSVLVSANTSVVMEAYTSSGDLLATAGPGPINSSTGMMTELRIDLGLRTIAYLEIHDTSNFFLIDAVCTDALGAAPRNDPRNVPVPFTFDSDFWDWPDADQDGLPDHWEAHGVWVSGEYLDLSSLGAKVDHKDLFIWVDAVNPDYFDPGVREHIRRAFDASPLSNPDSRSGVDIHFQIGDLSLSPETYGSASAEGVANTLRQSALASGYIGDSRAGDQSVPPIFKYLFFGESIPEASGTALGIPGSEAMIAVSNKYLDSIGPLVWATRRFWPGESRSFIRAVIATHELGHLLGLGHHGTQHVPVDDKNYKSVMSYAYSTFGLPPGFPAIANTIDYSRSGSSAAGHSEINLDWRMGRLMGALQLVRGQFGVGAENFYLEWQPGELRQTGAAPISEIPLSAQIGAADPAAAASFVQSYTSSFVPLAPGRLLESRIGHATIDNEFNNIGIRSAGSVTALTVSGRGGVAPDASAVVLNVAVDSPQHAGFVTVFPCGTQVPNAANLNYAAGQTTSNSVTAKVGANGQVCLLSSANTHLIVDVNGYHG